MRWLLLTISLMLGVALPAVAEVRDPNSHFFMPKLGDFTEDLAIARQEGKKGVLIMFELDDCPYCHRMKRTILNQSEIQDYFRKYFLIYAVDTKGDAPMVDFKGKNTSEKAFAFVNRIRATPVFVFFDLDGNPVARFTGATQSQAEFMLLGKYVAEGMAKTMSFEQYKQQAAK